jgi:hypothetical protein
MVTAQVRSTSISACTCPVGRYDVLNGDELGAIQPIWCWPSGLQNRYDIIEENIVALDEIKFLRCVTCPSCLNCSYNNYASRGGQPFYKANWSTYGARPAFNPVNPKGSLSMTRDVFGCPFEGACHAEIDTLNTTDGVCDFGYDGPLCSVCASGFVMHRSGCGICLNVGLTFAFFIVAVVAVIGIAVALHRNRQQLEL